MHICSHEDGAAMPAGGGAIIEDGDANRRATERSVSACLSGACGSIAAIASPPLMIWGALGIDPAYTFAP